MLTFDPVPHEYRWNGTLVPNVTSFTDRMISFGFASEAQLEAARERGTDVHHATVLDDINDLDESSVTEEIKPYLTAWRKFKLECKPQWVDREFLLYHPVYRYAGGADCIGPMLWPEGLRFTLADIKTGQPSPVTGIQLALYELAWHANPTNPRIERRAGIYLNREGKYKLKAYDETDHARAGLSLITLYNWSKAHGITD